MRLPPHLLSPSRGGPCHFVPCPPFGVVRVMLFLVPLIGVVRVRVADLYHFVVEISKAPFIKESIRARGASDIMVPRERGKILK